MSEILYVCPVCGERIGAFDPGPGPVCDSCSWAGVESECWTTALPTRVGWYWVTCGNSPFTVEIVTDDLLDRGLLVEASCCDDQDTPADWVQYRDGQMWWLGPLEVPKGPK